MLNLNNITKDYLLGDTTVKALKGVSIEFRDSEFVSVLGPSGCGKTTLLNIIGGLDRYTDGDLNINGRSTKDFKDSDWDSYRNHSIGFVFQSYNLILHQTVLANVELALTLSGVSKAERRKRATEVLEQVGLGDQLDKKPNQMSGGQMQRVAIARALVNDPDILLADEPTGALDTETSVQIMELLKKISKDKLIIMVTHNPELAEKYSSRIIKLLDGKVINDSDPINKKDKKKPKSEKKESETLSKKERKALKTSMSFGTALGLSRNNLLTKKARTLLTSFAGSIGIIGIALILSISNGIQIYIDQVQSDTLSTYPLQIQEATASVGEIMNIMAENREKAAEHSMDRVYSQNMMGEMINTLMKETKVNNLEKFKTFLDENEDLKAYTSDIKYGYSTTLNVFKADTSEGTYQVNPSQVLLDMGYMSDTQMMGMSALGGSMGTDVWTEMIDNEQLINSQYDVLAGHMPENFDETVLIVDKNNEVNDYILYSLGILDSSELNGLVRRALSGEDVSITSEQREYTYEELMELKFKLVPTTDFFKKQDGVWADMRDDYDFMKDVVDNGLELKIVGIVKPNEDAAVTSIAGGIAYKHELMEYLLEQIDKSEIVKEQLADPDTDVFNGLKFKDSAKGNNDEGGSDTVVTGELDKFNAPAEETELTEEQLAAIMRGEIPEGMTEEQVMAIMAKQSGDGEDLSSIGGDPKKTELTEEQLAAIMRGEIPEGMTEEQVMAIMASQSGAEGLSDEEIAAMMQQGGMSDAGELTDMGMGALGEIDMSKMMQGDQSFMNGLTETQKKYLASLSDEQMELMMQMIAESTQPQKDTQTSSHYSQSSYEANMMKLGYATVEKPSSINIYPRDFASKEEIIRIIDDYNANCDDADKIEYTDIVGKMMSSVTSIINAISYVLIAFVAISLVVSSIMIGIITYISVLERTKEIGILRSIGASKRDISRVFNAETTIVGFVAGLLGVGISYLLTIPINAIIAYLTEVPMRAQIPIAAAGMLVVISVILTLIAGLVPSRVAANKDPVIALRTE